MSAGSIAVVGGGPGGLFFAALAKSADPSRVVAVFERNHADDTFGFGVVFSDRTMAAIDDADPVLRTALHEHGVRWDPIEVRLKGQRILAAGNGMAAVVRRTLLRLLRERALEAGVEIHFDHEVDPGAVLDGGYDLVVAADGANSRIRSSLPDRFGLAVEVAAAKFIWFGTTYEFGGLTFVHERGPDGVFAVHGYPIGDGVGTFIVETDEESWRRAGLDEFDVTAPPGASDEKSRDYLQKLFAEQIEGHGLLVNNSRWGNFRTLRTEHWHTRAASGTAVVLLGDAAHTAHFSVGSGTKMAMEDAVSLAAALDHHANLDEALAAHESARRPSVEKIQGSARPSLSWWEHFGRYHDALEPWQFGYHFLSRSLTDAKLHKRDARFVDGVHAQWYERHGAAPLRTTALINGLTGPHRAVVVEPGVAHLGEVQLPLLPAAPASGPWGVLVGAPDDEQRCPRCSPRYDTRRPAVPAWPPPTAALRSPAGWSVKRRGWAYNCRACSSSPPGRAPTRRRPLSCPGAATSSVQTPRPSGHGCLREEMSVPTAITEGIVAWPPELAERYREAGYWAGEPLGSVLWRDAATHPDNVAVVDGEVRLTYAELLARADGLASALTARGLRAGDRIIVQLPNSWEFVALTLACFRAGIVPVMALPGHRRHELGFLVEHAEARAMAVPGVLRGFDHQALAHDLRAGSADLELVLVVGDEVRENSVDLRALAVAGDATDRSYWDSHPPSASAIALFLLSGGTTGLPKMIPRSHDDYAYNARRSAEICGLDEHTVYLGSLPLSHNFPLACPGILGVLLTGGRVVMLTSPEPGRAFDTIRAEGVTMATAVPAVAQRWLAHHRDNPSKDLVTLRLLQVGGARLADDVARQVSPLTGATLQQVFGMAEGLLNYTRLDDDEEAICTTQGRPMCPDDEIRLVDALDRDVPEGEAGSLLTRGPYTLRGYYRAEEQNLRAFTADGWYRSGDIVRRRPDGNLVVEGRDKDMINRGGEKISAEDVENLAYRIPEISQAAAVAMPDPELGERVCLFAVVTPGEPVTLARVRARMAADGVAAMTYPERLEIVEELPVTTVGKIDKKRLRAVIAATLEQES